MSTTVKSTPPRTPSPWRLESHGWDGLFIRGNDERVPGNNRLIAEASLMYDGAEANAAFIVRACNSHDALVESLQAMLLMVENTTGGKGAIAKQARAALAAAGVQP